MMSLRTRGFKDFLCKSFACGTSMIFLHMACLWSAK